MRNCSAALVAFAVGTSLLVAGCASSRDLRTLRAEVEGLRQNQEELKSQIAQVQSTIETDVAGTGQQVVDVKYTVQDMKLRMDQIDARLDDLDQRVSQPARAGMDQGGAPRVVPPDQQAAAGPGAEMPPAGLSGPVAEQYQQAFEALRRDDYAAAIEGFRAYLAQAGEAPEAGSAAYWIAESFYAQGRVDSALVQFQAVVDRYPDSDKVPAALYKIGNIYEDRGDKKSAFPYYRRLKEEFPQSLEYQQLRRKLGE
jgi:tol-pal system protein YbgF